MRQFDVIESWANRRYGSKWVPGFSDYNVLKQDSSFWKVLKLSSGHPLFVRDSDREGTALVMIGMASEGTIMYYKALGIAKEDLESFLAFMDELTGIH
jgi:hypothetical protein